MRHYVRNLFEVIIVCVFGIASCCLFAFFISFPKAEMTSAFPVIFMFLLCALFTGFGIYEIVLYVRYKEALKGILSTGTIHDKVIHRGRRGSRSYELQYAYTDEYGDRQIGCIRVSAYIFDLYTEGETVDVRISGKDGAIVLK